MLISITVGKNHKLQKRVSLSLPEKLSEKIDSDRGDVARSRFVTRLIERAYGNQESRD